MKKLFLFLGMILFALCSFGQMSITTSSINFRTQPDINGRKISAIPKGSLVLVVNDTVQTEFWTKVRYKGRVGFVYSVFLKSLPENARHQYDNVNSTDKVKYYKNSAGETVQSPTHYNAVPVGATAECNDGTYSFSRSRRGTCSHHGGVKRWL